MAKRIYTTPLPEPTQVWRSLHQYEWTVWEEREEIRHPHALGFPKVFASGQEFAIAKNGSTALERAEYAAPTIVVLDTETLPATPDPLSNIITIDFTAGQTARAEDYFADGILYVKDGTGAGLYFSVSKSEAITTTSTSAKITIAGEIFADDDGDSVLDTTSDVTLVSSIWRNIGQAAATSSFGGIPLDEVSADAYFWLQKRGPAVGKAADANTAIAEGAGLTPAADGTFAAAAAGDPIVAYALEAVTATEADAGDHIFAINLV